MALYHLTGSFWIGSGHSIDQNIAPATDRNRPEAVIRVGLQLWPLGRSLLWLSHIKETAGPSVLGRNATLDVSESLSSPASGDPRVAGSVPAPLHVPTTCWMPSIGFSVHFSRNRPPYPPHHALRFGAG